MSSNYKLEFTLKQHTPIIHFQSDQIGATLRATELKPKLDRFLIEKLKLLDENNKPKKEFKSWFISDGKQHLALDYKVKIEDDLSNEHDIENNPLYFGNMGKKSFEKIKEKRSTKKQNITFKTFNTILKEKIKDNFAKFLAITNFGTRQSKGFGSFYIDKNSPNYTDIEKVLNKNTYFLEINTTEKQKIEQTINYFWSRLKSGINLNYNSNCNKPYHPAFSKEYFYNKVDEKTTWDKRWMKETFFGLDTNSQNPKYIRALFGLSSTYSFKQTKEPYNKDKTLQIEDDYQIDLFSKDIKRIKSPITFKPIIENKKTKIYIIIDNVVIPKNKEFYFIKRFKYKYDDYENRGKTKYKTKLFPDYDPYKEPKPILGTLLSDIKDYEEKTSHKNSTKFDYKQQNERFKKFKEEFCEEENGLLKPQTFLLQIPDTFDIEDILKEYINSLKPKFSVEYLQNRAIQNINVEIKQVGVSS